MAKATGVEESLAMNVYLYAKNLTTPNQPNYIEKFVFIAQMWTRFGMTSKFLIDIIYESLKTKDFPGIVLDDYVHLVCVFLTKEIGPKIDYVFRCYDLKRDGHLDGKEIHTMLLSTLVTSSDDLDAEDHVKELMDLVMFKTDKNNDGIITFEEFSAFVRENILCIELLGSVLPLDKHILAFMRLIHDKTPHSVTLYFLEERRLCLNLPVIQQTEEKLFPVELEIPVL